MRHRIKLLLPLIFCIGALGLYGGQAPANAPNGTKAVSIIYTTDMQGKLESCG